MKGKAPITPPNADLLASKREDYTTNTRIAYRRLDSLARLFEYTGTCAATAYDADRNKIVIAYNKPSPETAALVRAYFELFRYVADHPDTEDESIKKRVLELIAESSSGLAANEAIESLIRRQNAYDIIISSVDSTRAGTFNPSMLRDAFTTLDLTPSKLTKKIEEYLNIISATGIGLELQIIRIKKLIQNSQQADKQTLEKQLEQSTKERDELSNIITTLKGDKQALEALQGRDKTDVLKIISTIKGYLEIKREEAAKKVQIATSLRARVDRPEDEVQRSHDLSRIMVDIDKVLEDLRNKEGSLYTALQAPDGPFTILFPSRNKSDIAQREPEGKKAPKTVVHAEMLIAEYFIKKAMITKGDSDYTALISEVQRTLPYIGVSKLCCYDCAKTLGVLCIRTRGAHNTVSPEWQEPEFFRAIPMIGEMVTITRELTAPFASATARKYADRSLSRPRLSTATSQATREAAIRESLLLMRSRRRTRGDV